MSRGRLTHKKGHSSPQTVHNVDDEYLSNRVRAEAAQILIIFMIVEMNVVFSDGKCLSGALDPFRYRTLLKTPLAFL